jgi:hypothetical protein
MGGERAQVFKLRKVGPVVRPVMFNTFLCNKGGVSARGSEPSFTPGDGEEDNDEISPPLSIGSQNRYSRNEARLQRLALHRLRLDDMT